MLVNCYSPDTGTLYKGVNQASFTINTNESLKVNLFETFFYLFFKKCILSVSQSDTARNIYRTNLKIRLQYHTFLIMLR